MRRLLSQLALTALLISPMPARGGAPAAAGDIRRSERAIPAQYIVVLKGDAAPREGAAQVDASGFRAGAVKAAAQALGSQYRGAVRHVYEHALRGFSVRMSEAAAEALSGDPRVAYVEEDSEFEGAGSQTGAPAGLDRVDQRDLPLDGLYSYPNSGANAHAYVIDTGIRTTHQEFGGRATADFDSVGDGQNGQDCHGHGTHVAGIVGGQTYGVAKGVRLHSVRVLGCANTGSASQIIAGLDWVAANHAGPAVALLAVNGTANTSLDAAVRGLITSGVTTVVAAGNNNLDAGFRSPSRVTEAITVGSVDQFDARASTSNFGSVLDLFAPGVGIDSAGIFSDTDVQTRNGTSMAAAFAAGAAALHLHVNPAATPAAVAAALNSFASANRVFNPGTGSPNFLLFRPSGTGGNGKVAFARDGNIWVMNADGTNQTRLTFNADYDFLPVWSPNGRKLAFTSHRDGNYEVYSMNPDGGQQKRLTAAPDYDGEPTWSSDGAKLAFYSEPGNPEVFTMNADGSGRLRVTNHTATDAWAAWQPR